MSVEVGMWQKLPNPACSPSSNHRLSPYEKVQKLGSDWKASSPATRASVSKETETHSQPQLRLCGVVQFFEIQVVS